MDYWCALWFWPIDEHDKAPTRQEWLMDLQMILEGGLYETQTTAGEQQALFESMEPEAKQLAMELKDEHGFVNVDKLCDRNPRLDIARDLADRYKFFHWELEYADLFKRRGGFDLTIGNPPWVKATWDDTGILGDAEPKVGVRGWSKSKLSDHRMEVIEENNLREDYLSDYEEDEGTQAFQNAKQNYPSLQGMQTNSYKCFLPKGWMVGNDDGVTAFLHPEGVYDDPKGGKLRKEIYPRLRGHYQFWNALFLFEDVHDQTNFSINVYQNEQRESVKFTNIANLYTPETIDSCFEHDGSGPTPGKRDEDHDWNTKGHSDRIVTVDEKALELFATLYDEEGTGPREARLSAVHSQQIMEVLHRFAEESQRLGDMEDEYKSTVMFDETYARRDGVIERDTQFIDEVDDWVLSGPHFFVGTPFYKTPREGCRNNQDYDELDLTNIPKNYLPRTNYVPSCSRSEYRRRTPEVPWSNDEGEHDLVTEFYRLAFRSMIGPSSMRTMIGTVVPPEAGHINGVQTTAYRSTDRLIAMLSICQSVVADFYIKTTGRQNLHFTWHKIPWVDVGPAAEVRTLLLNSLTTHYADLWADSWQNDFTSQSWTKSDTRLNADTEFSDLTGKWDWDTPLRTRYARRQALVELDVLVAQALGLTLEELQTIYRVQFGVLRKWEQNTWYDQNGRIIYTRNSGLPGVGFKSRKWKEVKDMESGTVEQTVEDNTQPGGPTERTIVYEAPFDKCDREEDYRRAWEAFESRNGSIG
jgi:hypothetical protein